MNTRVCEDYMRVSILAELPFADLVSKDLGALAPALVKVTLLLAVAKAMQQPEKLTLATNTHVPSFSSNCSNNMGLFT